MNLDSLNRYTIEIGKSFPWYLEDQNLHFYYPTQSKFTYSKISFIWKRKYIGFSAYKDELYLDNQKASIKNDVLSRFCIGSSVFFGKSIFIKHIKTNFIPQFNAGFRKGYERIILQESMGWHKYETINYEYLSPSIGCSLELNKTFFKVFVIGIENQFYHFFESRKPYDFANNTTDLLPEHKINKNVLNFVIKFGIHIDWNTRTGR